MLLEVVHPTLLEAVRKLLGVARKLPEVGHHSREMGVRRIPEVEVTRMLLEADIRHMLLEAEVTHILVEAWVSRILVGCTLYQEEPPYTRLINA
jgi:hypothetical protein